MKYKSYSIAEIIVVVCIIALLSSILVPLLGMFAPKTRLIGDAKVMMSALRKVQQWSISGEKRYGIDFYPDERKYILFRRDINNGVVIIEVETVDLSSNINIQKINFDGVATAANPEGYIRVQFDSFGAPRDENDNHIHAEVFLINQKNDTLTVDIRKNTGHVKIF